ncbi:MAG: hypothetical protein GXP27_17620 [Planctomycetes bacterium]|nr:hypothetical protein [Planctomycetota bacterium]
MKTLKMLSTAARALGAATMLLFMAAESVAQRHPALPPAGRIDGLGVNIHFTDPRPGEVEMLAAGGFRWIRMDFTWSRTEPEPGRYDFSPYVRLLKSLEPHGIRVLFILDYSNRLYEENNSVATERGRKAFARWAAAAAKRFKGRGILWEIWNEPNIPHFWKPKPNVDDYAKLALAAARAIREAAPGEAIVGPATSRIDLQFLEGCFQRGLLQHWDAVSVHPYRQSAPETVAAEYYKLRRLISRYSPPGKSIPILSGEWGYSAVWRGFDPQRQGKMLARQWLTNLSLAIPLSIWYDWHDDGRDPHEPEHHFGTVAFKYHAGRSPVYDAKPAYLAAKTLTSVLDGFRFVKRLATGRPDEYALLFRRDDQLRLAVWTTAGTELTVRLPSDPCRFDVVDHLGRRREPLQARDGTLTVRATDAPQYLFGPWPNKRLAAVPVARLVTASFAPVGGEVLSVRIEKHDALPFRGRVELTDVAGIEPLELQQPIAFPADVDEGTIRFTLASGPTAEYRVGLRVSDEQSRVVDRVPARRIVPLPDEFWSKAHLVPDGDPKVRCKLRLETGRPPEALAGCDRPVLKVTYQFEPGWKFLRLVPPDGSRRTIAGKPIAFGIWLYGDGQGGSPRLRVRDATGQTWQPTGQKIDDWKGWRFVEFPLSRSAGHWGGAEDGVIHFPLRWDTIFLLDNVSRQQAQGTVYVTAPVVIYEK